MGAHGHSPADWTGRTRELASELSSLGVRRVEVFGWRDLADPESGGSEVHADHVLSRWAASGLDVVYRASSADGPRDFRRNGYRIVQRGGRYDVFARVALPRVIPARRGDVAVVEIWNGVPWFSPLWRCRAKAVWLHHVHEDMWGESLPAPLAPLGRALELRIAPPFYRRARITTLAETTRSDLVARGFSPDLVNVAEPGIHPRFSPDPASRSPHPTVVAVGRLAPVKRFPLLVDEFARVLARVPDARLVIVGDGPDRVELAAHVARTGLGARITLAGRVDDEALVAAYRSAWIVASASHSEGWGMTVTEAAACATPCVVSDNHGHRAAVVDGETGVVVPEGASIGDAIADLLVDRSRRDSMSTAALGHSRLYDWDRTACILLGTLVADARSRA